MRYALAGAALVVLLFGLLIRGWLHTGAVMSRERLRCGLGDAPDDSCATSPPTEPLSPP